MKCNKPYSVTSSNPKMSGSEKPMRSYMGGGMIRSYEKGGMVKGSMPDLTGDGKVTRADVLKGRGVFKDGGMVKSYQKGGVITMPRMTAKQEMMANLKKAKDGFSPYGALKSKKDAVARAEMKERIMGPQEKRKGPGTYTPQAWRQREMEMAMSESEMRRKK